MRLNATENGNGQPLVLLHGWGLNGGVWDTLVPLLAPRYRCIMIDLPGHGASPAVGGGLAAWATACLEVAPPRALWLGWSLGGMVALAAALQAPAAVAGLRLVATTPRFVTAPDWPQAVAPETLADFAAELAADWRGTVEKFLVLQTLGGAASKTVLRALRATLLGADGAGRGLAAGLAILETADLRARLGEIRAPAQVLAGARDRLTPPAAGRALATALGAPFMAMPGAAHAPFLSDPAGFIYWLDTAVVAA